jgi:RND family efflux transporter MFP subunit
MRLIPIESADKSGPAATPSPSGVAQPIALPVVGVGATGSGVSGHAPIEVSPEGMRLAGVQTAVAEQGNIERTIRAAGVVRADERRIRHVHTKVAGWIEKLYADFTGEAVHKGRPILTIYSQELLASQQEYLRAREGAQKLQGSSVVGARQGADAMLAAARERLELFDVPPEFIAALDHTGAPQRTVTLLAPASGIVTAKQIVEGQQIEPGMELFSISDLSRVWIEADVYESEASAIHVGQDARLALPSDPGAPLTGKVKYIYPYLSPDTRTLKVRFDFANPGLKLKLDMFVNVDLTVQTDEGVIVPDSAIMDTGVRQIAFANPTNGRFEPRLVKVGIRADGKAQILDGIKPGERVATKANFLLDSESRLRAAISGAEAQPAASDGAP